MKTHFNLTELDFLLPIVCRDTVLQWLKLHYKAARDAVAVGDVDQPIISLRATTVTAQDFLTMMDTKEGRINSQLASLLVTLVIEQQFDIRIIDRRKSFDASFYQFAMHSNGPQPSFAFAG